MPLMPFALMSALRADVPVELGREEAQRLAQRELADPAYRAAEPGLVQRAIEWLVDQLAKLAQGAADVAPGGWVGILGLLALVALTVLVVRWRTGPVSGSGELTFTVDAGVSGAQYRARAGELAAAGQWDAAVTEQMRALVRRCQERGLIDGQPGWTADEVAREVADRLPGTTADLAGAARTFDAVRYGGRPAEPSDYERLTGTLDLLERTRPVTQAMPR